jgi:hypothetical protein
MVFGSRASTTADDDAAGQQQADGAVGAHAVTRLIGSYGNVLGYTGAYGP